MNIFLPGASTIFAIFIFKGMGNWLFLSVSLEFWAYSSVRCIFN
jgi:hypothetical protein